MIAPDDTEAPVTLRSPPSTLRVRDHVPCVELAECPEAVPAYRAPLESGEFAIESEPPTRHWRRAA